MASTSKLELSLPNWSPNTYASFGGVRQDLNATAGPETTFNDLTNFRPRPGGLLQTDPFFPGATLTQYSGESASSSSARLRALAPYISGTTTSTVLLAIRQSSVRTVNFSSWTQTQVPVVSAQKGPATFNTDQTHGSCLFIPSSVFTTDIAQLDTFDVQILAGGTTFQFRKNAGAWNGPLACSTGGTALTLVGAFGTVYFLSNSGFTAGDTWTWVRDDRLLLGASASVGDVSNRVSDWVLQDGTTFVAHQWGGDGNQLFAYANGVYYSAGYYPIFCKFVTLYQNHLVVGSVGPTVVTGSLQWSVDITNNLSYKRTTLWSDLNNLHNFVPTLTNEADTYLLPESLISSSLIYRPQLVGVKKLRDWCMLYTTQGIYRMTYVGLPNVMQIEQVSTVGAISNCIVEAAGIHYFIGTDNVYAFDGSNVEPIGTAIAEWFPTIGGVITGWYDPRYEDICFLDTTNDYIYIYSTRYRFWSRRASISTMTCAHFNYVGSSVSITAIYGYHASNTGYLVVDTPSAPATSTTPIKERGTTYVLPTFETQFNYAGDPRYIKEITGFYLDGGCNSVTSDATIKAKLSYEIRKQAGSQASAAASWTAVSGFWPTISKNFVINLPRLAGRCVRFKVEVQDGSDAPLTQLPVIINAFGPLVNTTTADV